MAGNSLRQNWFLNVIKYLGNELKLPIVAVGTQDAFNALSTDPQLANRFEPAVLPRWHYDREFLRLLMSFEQVLPLRNESRLGGGRNRQPPLWNVGRHDWRTVVVAQSSSRSSDPHWRRADHAQIVGPIGMDGTLEEKGRGIRDRIAEAEDASTIQTKAEKG
jgi:Bacterial TniB protein